MTQLTHDEQIFMQRVGAYMHTNGETDIGKAMMAVMHDDATLMDIMLKDERARLQMANMVYEQIKRIN